jgi:hypothetical protein
MERCPAGHFLSAEAEGGAQERQCLYLRLLARGLAVEDAAQFVGQHRAHAGTALCGKSPSPLQEVLLEGESDVPLHMRGFILHVKYVNGTGGDTLCQGKVEMSYSQQSRNVLF